MANERVAQVKPKFPVSEEDKKKSYYKYYERAFNYAPCEWFDDVVLKRLDDKDVLQIYQRNRLFDPNYEHKRGFWSGDDGTGYQTAILQNQMFLPGVTGEMFDWWFGWHSIDSLRYKIWDPEDHAWALNQDLDRILDESLPVRERNWYTNHHIDEMIFSGHPYGFPEGSIYSTDSASTPASMITEDFVVKRRNQAYKVPFSQPIAPININFLPPFEYGFDMSLVGTELCSTVVCGNSVAVRLGEATITTAMCHFLKPAEGGSTLYSTFWGGYSIMHGQVIKNNEHDAPAAEPVVMMLLLHNIKEFYNLSSFLPELYEEEKDHWGPEIHN